ncbi:diamine N-acetyltransferase [Planctomycetaceae bacterium]|nr:diamine N-acetyltransferase [Planctomycetaceae bacterium]
MAIRIRRATLRDLPLLIRHRRGMFEDMKRGSASELTKHDRNYAKWARQRLSDGSMIGFVALQGKEVAASGCVWLREKQPAPGYPGGRVPYLLSMFTERHKRGLGAATAIVKAALAWAKKRKLPLMLLHASDAGRPIYERLGFKATNEMEIKL